MPRDRDGVWLVGRLRAATLDRPTRHSPKDQLSLTGSRTITKGVTSRHHGDGSSLCLNLFVTRWVQRELLRTRTKRSES